MPPGSANRTELQKRGNGGKRLPSYMLPVAYLQKCRDGGKPTHLEKQKMSWQIFPRFQLTISRFASNLQDGLKNS